MSIFLDIFNKYPLVLFVTVGLFVEFCVCVFLFLISHACFSFLLFDIKHNEEPTLSPSKSPTMKPSNAPTTSPTPMHYCPLAYNASDTSYGAGDQIEAGGET